MVKEKEKLAYINPEKSQEEKAKGNDKFKQGNYQSSFIRQPYTLLSNVVMLACINLSDIAVKITVTIK